MAGPWLKYRGHLENISGNLFLGAVERVHRRGRRGQGPTRRRDQAVPGHRPSLPRGWSALGGGRRRELGRGLEPRARCHGAAIPRGQGDHRSQLRPHPRDQPQEAGRARTHLRGPRHLRRGRRRTTGSASPASRIWPRADRCSACSPKPDGTTIEFHGNHTMSEEHIEWFRAGSALNIIRSRTAS